MPLSHDEWKRIIKIRQNFKNASDEDKQYVLTIYKRELDAGNVPNVKKANRILTNARKAGFNC